jgi:cytochrome c-type biogenesis protein CcsB
MPALSDHLLVATILIYVAAMFGYLIEYAFGDRGVIARAAPARPLILVGPDGVPVEAQGSSATATAPVAPTPTASPVSPAGPVPPAGPIAPGRPERPPAPTGRTAWFGRFAVTLTALGLATHAATLITRGLAAGRVPWGNMYEFIIAVTLVASVAWLGVLIRRPALRPLGMLVTLVLAVSLGIAGMVYTPPGPLVPALNSYWLKIHVSAAALASGILLFGFVCAVLHLVRDGYDSGRRRFPYTLGDRLPAADRLEQLTFRVHAFAFPIWTFAIICGAIWAEAAWGRYWGWDPKETWAFISWVVYASYLHARATTSISRRITTWIAVLGWTTMLIDLYGVNLVISGLHSYAGVK